MDSVTDPYSRNLGFLDREMGPSSHIKQRTISLALVHERTIPSDSRLSAKIVPMFTDKKCSVVSVTDPYDRNLGFLDRSRYIFFQVASQLYSRS
jgi:hypothetical protein